MLVPLSWLKDYVALPSDAANLVERLTLAGLEAAGVRVFGLSVPAAVDFVFAYGPGSFRCHTAEARRLGLGVRVVRDRGESVYTALDSPDSLLVVAAGGPAGGFGAVIPPWMGHKTKAVTAAIGACADCEP